jgi:hypothetical protein
MEEDGHMQELLVPDPTSSRMGGSLRFAADGIVLTFADRLAAGIPIETIILMAGRWA